MADKYLVKKYISDRFGPSLIVPILKKYDSWKDITLESLPEAPFIIKANTGTGTWTIVRNKNDIDIKEIKKKCREWMTINCYYRRKEWQYKNINPCIIVEPLITDSKGNIPKDYKLHYFNGELQFIYCVIDREGDAYRALFSPAWELLPFQWVSVENHTPLKMDLKEPRPVNLKRMIEIGNELSKGYSYIRIDFMECNGNLYFGEMTFYHGSGYNKFYPPDFEAEYSKKLSIM
jgi:hypothetical protein